MISEPLRRQREVELGPIGAVRTVAGGSIGRAFRVDLEERPVFLKVQSSAPDGFFEAERRGLLELARAETPLHLPKVIALGRAADEAYLVLEWVEQSPAERHEELLGRGLAQLHRRRGGGWGFERDGFIGPLAQPNASVPSWSDFWMARRLEPQLRSLEHEVGSRSDWAELEQLLPALLAPGEKEGPSLLHGDLWSGNVMSTATGPALVDPACFYGHREVDLAMADLFGGFGRAFFDSYNDCWPLQPGYEARKGVYQLYYLLVHVNLFGASYVSRTHHMLRRILNRA